MFRRLSLVLLLLLSILNAKATETHSIKSLKLSTEPKTPKQGEAVDRLDLDFELVSSDGLDDSRFRLLINDVEQSLNGSNITFSNNIVDSSAGTESADVKIESFNKIFNKVSNELKLQYLISKDTTENPRTEKTIKNIVALPTDNVDSNGNSTATSIINISIEDSLGTDAVSSTSRFIKITARHDKRVIPEITNNNFNSITNPITKNIKVKKIKAKEKTFITDEFSFSLEAESIDIGNNLLQTVFKTNNLQILEKQELEFKINLRTFYQDTGLNLGTKVISSDKESIKFTATPTEVVGLSLSGDINFKTLSTNGKGVNQLSSDDVNLVINYILSDNGASINSIEKINFFTRKKGKTTKAKISAIKNTRVDVINSSSPSFSENSLTIPIKLSLKSNTAKLEKKGFLNSNVSKRLNLPFRIFARDSNGVEVILESQEEISTVINFELPSQ